MKYNSDNKTIFVGGDFGVYQYIWLIHVLDGYSQKNKINTIIFEYKKDFEKIRKFQTLVNFNSKYKVLYLDELLPWWFSNRFVKFFIFLYKTLVLYLRLKFFKNSFFNSFTSKNIYLGVMDFAYRNSKQNIYPSFKDLIFSSYHFVQKKYKAKFLIRYDLNAVFLAHSVYHSRAFLIKFREENIKIFNNSFSLYQQKKTKDARWDFPSKEFFDNAIKIFNKDIINDYWNKRQLGLGNYDESNIALKIENVFENEKIYNIVFLHVFKDSPNSFIDETKIFLDYFQWFKETLKIISLSKEIWLIKMHPSYKKWGEDQPQIVEEIIKLVSIKYNLNNIIIDDLKRSNMSLIKNAKKIVTYAGSIALESICSGKKPIVISSTMIDHYNNNLVYKPKNIKEYSELILNKNTEQDFIISDKDIYFAKFLIFMRENVLNLTTELNYIYRWNPIIKDSSIKNYFKVIEKKKKFLNKLGKLLGNKISHSVSETFLNKIDE